MLIPEGFVNYSTNAQNRPILPQSVFANRRKEFLERLGKGAAIIVSAPSLIRTNDTEHRYRQNSDFYYLTGLTEPESVCLFLPEHPEHKFVLFVRPRNQEKEIWDGHRFGPEAAQAYFGADAAYSIEKLDEELPKYLKKVDSIYYSLGHDPHFDQRIINQIKYFRSMRRSNGIGPFSIVDPIELLQEMRLFKSAEELGLMRYSANIAAQGHIAAMEVVKPGMYEFEIEAIVEHQFKRCGAISPAYSSIIGSGPNATILHYRENDRQFQDNELLLVDAGAEYEYYCSDITRTYPVNGRFTKEQREIYEIVLEAQLTAIDRVRPGVEFDDVHDIALKTIVDGLLKLGLLNGSKEEIIKEKKYEKFFMHRTSHWLGIDTHDVGRYKLQEQSRKLESGMILTVEPGIYIREIPDVPIKYHNIGVRIEDDILVTEQGSEVLTVLAPKQIRDLENIIGRRG